MRKPLIVLALLAASTSAVAQDYCRPKDGRDRIPKTGTCPTGYRSSGDCCEAFRSTEPRAFPKIEGKACPSGTYASGRYCKEFR